MYVMGTLLRHGSAEQKQRYLPRIASGALRMQSFAVTEPTTGSDTTRIRTFAARDGDRYVVNGEKGLPGVGELFRMISFGKIGTSALQSRATAGVAGDTYLFALPGSPGACRDGWDEILVHQLDIRFRPCNFAELLPRLGEQDPGSRG
jgi:hypothetical protein